MTKDKGPIRIGIVTVSDRASQGVYQDLGGPAIRDCLTEILSCPWEPVARLIPDGGVVRSGAFRPGGNQRNPKMKNRATCWAGVRGRRDIGA